MAGVEEVIGVELEDLIVEVPMLSSEAAASVNETSFELSVPQPAYGPGGRSSRHHGSPE